mmetsp:Transcript_20694/g.41399  ORF Transcript_20694/g.41399 Transcript_20694/m.41399 type:complete len:340 (+) Transcript_20694:114-1133(+)
MARVASLLLPLLLSAGAAAALSPLCVPPAPGQDDTYIDCEVEVEGPKGIAYQPAALLDDGELVVLEYNIDRNGGGGDGSNEGGLEPIIDLLKSDALPDFDVLILSEVSRGCDGYGGGDVSGAAAIAAAFPGYWSAYAVEFVEYDAESTTTGECSIGNAIVSKFPFASVDSLTFSSQCCRYGGRWGGRSAVKADLVVGSDGSSPVRIVSTHLESGQSDVRSVINGTIVRERQAAELAQHFPSSSTKFMLIGGDMNSPLRSIDPTRLTFQWSGFHDSHDSIPWRQRNTCPDAAIAQYAKALTLDFLYIDDEDRISEVGICNDEEVCNGHSDHVPIFGKYRM